MKKADPFENYFYLGKIVKPHAFDGKVNAFLDTDEPEIYHHLEMVFLNISGNPVPFFIQGIRVLNNKATIHFQDTNDLEAAESLVNKEMYLPLSELPTLSGNKFYFHEVKGFTLIDKNHGELGTIAEVLEYPNQAVFQVMHDNKEILIPISDEVIKKVDRQKKEIHVQAPEGLVEIYL